jgi:hypothetical protein
VLGKGFARSGVGLATTAVLTATILLALGNALWSAWDQGWTTDEPFHLLWARRFLDTGVSERASHSLLNSKTSIMLPNVLAEKAASRAGLDERATRFVARLPTIGWLALLLTSVFVLADRTLDRRAAVLATIAAALDPNLVAHASVATSDEAFALATLVTLAAGLALAAEPSPSRGLALGLALGFAFVAKVTAFLLLPGLAVLPWIGLHRQCDRRRLGIALAAAVAAVWLVVSAAYLFREMGVPLGALGLRSVPLAGLAHVAPGVPLPLPAAFVTALDASVVSERGDWDVIILGRRYTAGVWYYFVALWLVKTPLLVVGATIVGVVRTARDPTLRRRPIVRLLAWNLVLLLGYFSLMFRAQIGYRYVLMALPLVYIVASAGLAGLRASRRVYALAGIVLAVTIAENLAYLGNPLSFTNAAVWPKRMAYRLIADSNIDWGQNRERIGRWLWEQHLTHTHLNPVHILPGHNTIDLNEVAGVRRFERYRWVREHLAPMAHIGYTYLLYDIDQGAFDEFLEQSRRLIPDSTATDVCPEGLEYRHVPRGGTIPLVHHQPPTPDEMWTVCVIAPDGANLGLYVETGSVAYGRRAASGACDTEPVSAGQESWWRLEPGTHTLCVLPQPNRRPWLPYRLEARWLVLGRHVGLNVRSIAPVSAASPPG